MSDLHTEDKITVSPTNEQIDKWDNFKSSRNFRGIGGVKSANDVVLISPQQARYYAEEIKRCKNDVIHFAENWFYIISYRGKEKIKLYPKQKEIIKMFMNNPFSIVLSGRQQGKCVAYNTQITIRHKKTGLIGNVDIGEFYKLHFNTQKIQIHLEVKHKFIEQRSVSKYEVLTDTGWVDIKGVAKTTPFKIQSIYTDNYELDCADEHIVFDKDWNEVFVKDLKLNDIIQTENGPEKIVAIDRRDFNPIESMYDLLLGEETNHRYITNGIISHNSTIYTIFALYYCMFNKDKKVLMVANKEGTVKELLQRIKMAITMLPDFLKLGITTWSAKKVEFENGSSISISATSPDAARGSSCDICVDDNSWIVIKENDEIKHVPITYLLGKVDSIDLRKKNYKFKELLDSELNKPINDINEILNRKAILKFHSYHNCFSIPHCPICGKKLAGRFRNGKYYITCSTKCAREFNKKYSNDLNPEYDGIKILTNNGFEKFDGISISNSEKQYRINFENSSEITCSPNHKFIVNGKLVKADQLNVGDNVFTINNIAKIKSIDVIKSKTHLYDIINSGKDHLFCTNGIITHNCILDEAAFIPNNIMDEFTASVFPTISSKPDGKIIAVSTPNGIGNWFERTYHKALYAINGNKGDDLQWQQITFPWYDHPERDENWRKKQIAMLGNDIQRFNQEFACEFLGSSSTLFDSAVLEHYRKYIEKNIDEYKTESMYNYDVKIWKEPEPNHAYVLGVDIADGSGGDNSVIQIFDVTNYRNIEQVVSFNSRQIDTNTLALITTRLGLRYNTALVSGERNGVGAGFFDALCNVFEYDNTINFKNKEEMADRPGIYSTNNNKIDACLWAKQLLSLSLHYPEYAQVILRENSTCYEMEYFESKTLNRTVTYNASKNNHDDFVMSFIWAMFALRLDMAENYFNVRSSLFTKNGIEVPQILRPLETSQYTEDKFLERLEGNRSKMEFDMKMEDSSKREMIQDSIYNAMMGNDNFDNW